MRRGHYESNYLRAVDPAAPRAVWIRHTTHRRPGAPRVDSLWCTVFDAAADGPLAVKATPGEGELMRGRATALGRTAAWDVRFAGTEPPLRHLPRPWMYAAPLPRTKLESPLPDATFDGWVEIDGRRVELAGWRGMVGHNWGAQHAERWIWLHAVFAGAWLDLAVARARLGPATTPWIAAGALHHDGRRIRLSGRPAVHATPTEARVRLAGLTIHARANPKDIVAWVYADPPGGEHHALNCSIAALDIPELGLATSHGGAYELGVRERDHGIALQPFPDG